MSDVLITQLFATLMTALVTGFVAWVTARYGVKKGLVGVTDKVIAVEDKVIEVGKSLDGRLTQWKEETSQFVEMAIQRAREQGQREGRANAGNAADLAATAEQVAAKVVATAEHVAEKVLSIAENKKL